jgi:hypothetical protein
MHLYKEGKCRMKRSKHNYNNKGEDEIPTAFYYNYLPSKSV